jgi:SAM-dependent methyltransferase
MHHAAHIRALDLEILASNSMIISLTWHSRSFFRYETVEKLMFDVHGAMESQHWWFVARARIIRQVLRKIDSGQGESMIVDVGCGTGGMVNFLADDFRCLGVDVSESAISMATTLYPGRSFKCGNALTYINALQNPPSVCLLMDVLEHLEDDRTFLEDLIKALPIGGKVMITVPADKKLWSRHDETAHHFRRYDREEFENLWAGMPVTPLCLSYFNARLYPLIRLARFLGNRFSLTWGKNKTDFAIPPELVNRLLISIFEGESNRILDVIKTPQTKPYTVGVSLIAVLEKTDDTIDPELR